MIYSSKVTILFPYKSLTLCQSDKAPGLVPSKTLVVLGVRSLHTECERLGRVTRLGRCGLSLGFLAVAALSQRQEQSAGIVVGSPTVYGHKHINI